jgi:DNA-nicking Smr family endonuclease
MKNTPPKLDAPLQKKRVLQEEEALLWRILMGEDSPQECQPLPQDIHHQAMFTQVAPSKPVKKTLSPSVLDKPVAAKIRRGALAIEATLDLHGHTREQAYEALVKRVTQWQEHAIRTALIITGKGRMGARGTLRELLPRWLAESPLRERIIAYDIAAPRHGGEGAWYVRIRKGLGARD